MTKKNFCNNPEWNALMLSTGFFFLFLAFNTIQSYATSFDPKTGSLSFGIIYSTAIFAAPFAPIIINYLDFKYSLILAFIVYSTYNFSYFIQNDIFYIITSFLCGATAPIMWTSQGSYLTQCCNVFEYQHKLSYNSQIGWFKGLFYSLFACHTSSGYLFAAIYFQFYQSNHLFFAICAIISYASCFFIFIFRFMPQQKYIQNINTNKSEEALIINDDKECNPENEDKQEPNKSICNQFKSVFQGWGDSKLQSLIFMIMYGGNLIAFIFGEFPSLITDTKQKFYAMTCYGVFGTIFAYIFGRISDKYGAILVLIICCSLNLIVFIVILCWDYYKVLDDEINNDYDIWIWLVLSAILGMSGPIIGQMVSVLFAKLLGNKPLVFAKRSLLGGLTSASGFFYHPYLSLKVKMIINITLCVLGVLNLFWHPPNRRMKV